MRCPGPLQALEQQVGLSLPSLVLLIRVSFPIKSHMVGTGQSVAALPMNCAWREMGFFLPHHVITG